MTDIRTDEQTFDVLHRTLETFGADQRRWPVDVRPQLESLLAESRVARARVAEAAALDRVLDFAPRLSDERLAQLTERIGTQVPRQPRIAATSASGSIEGSRARRPETAAWLTRNWHAHSLSAAALAASLVLGVVAGQTATVASLTNAMVNSVDASGGQQVAQGDDGDSLLDEDLL